MILHFYVKLGNIKINETSWYQKSLGCNKYFIQLKCEVNYRY